MAIILIVAVLAGAAGGLLSWLGGSAVANAILTGAGSFAGTVILLLAIGYFLVGEKP
ncbi:hypothetical protein [Streptosporangium subroseum]|uniref:hypothetical protein n=1 Tax=Streptosporangium subroseum TaxID=106412 RepID=UPI0030879047|nr:hypothetical protein OHB15_18815 [Streptosporangium subroseum]